MQRGAGHMLAPVLVGLSHIHEDRLASLDSTRGVGWRHALGRGNGGRGVAHGQHWSMPARRAFPEIRKS